MDIQRLKQLLSREENEKMDFKAQLKLTTEGEKKELVKDVTAIANSRGGRGYIIFGVEDKTKRIIGIEPDNSLEERIQQIIYNRTDPPVPVSLDLVKIKNKTVAVLTIFKSKHAPHQMLQTGAFYVRRGSTTDFARRSELASMMQENGLMTFETVIVKQATLEDLEMDRVNAFFRSINVYTDQSQTLLMEAFGFIGQKNEGEFCPTIGGLLLFGKNPQLFLPQCFLKIINGDEIDIISGNILSMLDQAVNRVKTIISDENYPFAAFEEALANALVHRDYMDLSRGVLINVTNKAIEIINPGALTQSKKVFLNIRECQPVRRNAWLYQRIIAIDENRRFIKSGLGMDRIRKSFEGIGEVKFINLGKQNSFKVILPR